MLYSAHLHYVQNRAQMYLAILTEKEGFDLRASIQKKLFKGGDRAYIRNWSFPTPVFHSCFLSDEIWLHQKHGLADLHKVGDSTYEILLRGRPLEKLLGEQWWTEEFGYHENSTCYLGRNCHHCLTSEIVGEISIRFEERGPDFGTLCFSFKIRRWGYVRVDCTD